MIIKDKVLSNYFIEVERYGYFLKKSVKRKKKDGTLEDDIEEVGYYVNFGSCISQIILELAGKDERVVTLKEFLTEYKEQSEKILNLLK